MTHFELPKMIKRIPLSTRNTLFAAVQRSLNVPINFDNSQVTKNKIDPILEALRALPKGDLNRVKSSLYWIHVLSENVECVTLLSHILHNTLGELPAEYQAWSMLERVIYAYDKLPSSEWEMACTFSLVHEYSKREWTILDLQLPHEITPKTSEIACFSLKEAVCDLIKKTEFRGEHGQCRHYFRPDRNQDYFVIYMNDHPLNKIKWLEGDNFEVSVSRDAFKVDFIYDRTTMRLEIHIKGPGEMRKRLAEVWVKQILGLEGMFLKNKEPYQIQHFKCLESDFLTVPPASCITEAKVVELHTFLFGDPELPRYFGARGSKELYRQVKQELNNGYCSLLDMEVRKIVIRIKYRTALGVERTEYLRITPTTSNIKNFPEELQADVEKFTIQQEICHAVAA